MNIIVIILISMSLQASAKPSRLAFGGEINLNEKEWEVVDTKGMLQDIPQSFVHKKYPDLKGWLMGGTPDSVAKCSKHTKNKFGVCSEKLDKDKISYYQIILTREVAKKAFQNYVISFSFAQSEKSKYGPIVEEFVSQITRVK